MRSVVLVKYGEIFLRGKNKNYFVNKLMKDISFTLREFESVKIIKEQGRFIITSETEYIDTENIIKKVKKCTGVVMVCPCLQFEDQNIDSIIKNAVEYLKENLDTDTFSFKVETRRAIKKYPLTSNEVSREVGHYVLENFKNSKVNLHTPDIVVNVELRNNAYIYFKRVKCVGGLPAGTSGSGILLLSGGIDSPVAGYKMLRRGIKLTAIYFDSPPFTSERAKDKVKELANILSEFGEKVDLIVVPFTKLQQYLYENTPHEKLTIFMKRCMLKISEKIARKMDINCLITGDSIGQVASQNVDSLAAIQSHISLPILRPLSGDDKQDIVDLAKQIDTYEVSILPYEDCCTIFVPEHPDLSPKISDIELIESELESINELIQSAIDDIEVYK